MSTPALSPHEREPGGADHGRICPTPLGYVKYAHPWEEGMLENHAGPRTGQVKLLPMEGHYTFQPLVNGRYGVLRQLTSARSVNSFARIDVLWPPA